MLTIKPPTHTVDGLATYVSYTDPAWDTERLDLEREAFLSRALERKRDAAKYPADPAEAAHLRESIKLTADEATAAVGLAPVQRYYAGRTRYQLDAPDSGADGAPVTARSYLKGKPTEFGLRRLNYRDYQLVDEANNPRARLIEACRKGLRSIKTDGYSWQAADGAGAGDEQLEALHAANPALLTEIGTAVLILSRKLDPDAELPR